MIVVKLGGSTITDKTKPLTARRQNIASMVRAVARICGGGGRSGSNGGGDQEPVVVVHGGGSFGHYWSVKYDMHTAERSYDLAGVATVKNSMVQLSLIILEEMLKGGAKPYALPPAGFMAGPSPIPSRVSEMGLIAESGMVPVTYGDAVWYGKGDKTYILSGDRIVTHLARIMRPRLCIFALGEDGLYDDMESRRLVETVTASEAARLARGQAQVRSGVGSKVGDTMMTGGTTATAATAADAITTSAAAGNVMDVTGGMTRKVAEAAAITDLGTPVAFVNGTSPDRMLDAAAGRRFKGTLFEGREGLKEKNKA